MKCQRSSPQGNPIYLPSWSRFSKIRKTARKTWFCPRVPVHKSRYKGRNNTQQLTNDSLTKKERWLFPCEPVHQDRTQNLIISRCFLAENGNEKIYNARASLLFCSLNLLFSEVPVVCRGLLKFPKEFLPHSESADLRRIEHDKAEQQNTMVGCCRTFNYLNYSELPCFIALKLKKNYCSC